MPTISFFYGIAIRMYYRDHAPPHFHAIYGEHEAFVSIETGEIIAGHLPKAAARLVNEWACAPVRTSGKLGARAEEPSA